MNQTLTGVEAYSAMISAECTYEPHDNVRHAKLATRVRLAIAKAGYKITGENYLTDEEGQIAVGTFKINYKDDERMELAVCFTNDYLNPGASELVFGASLKKHDLFVLPVETSVTGADLVNDKMLDAYLEGADAAWNIIDRQLTNYENHCAQDMELYNAVGQLFFEKKLLTPRNLNNLRKYLPKPVTSEMDIYCCIAAALNENEAANWMQGLQYFDRAFELICGYTTTPLAEFEPLMIVPQEETPEELPAIGALFPPCDSEGRMLDPVTGEVLPEPEPVKPGSSEKAKRRRTKDYAGLHGKQLYHSNTGRYAVMRLDSTGEPVIFANGVANPHFKEELALPIDVDTVVAATGYVPTASGKPSILLRGEWESSYKGTHGNTLRDRFGSLVTQELDSFGQPRYFVNGYENVLFSKAHALPLPVPAPGIGAAVVV